MQVVNLNDLNETERDIKSETWRSRRMVLAREGVGFSFHLLRPDTSVLWHGDRTRGFFFFEPSDFNANRSSGPSLSVVESRACCFNSMIRFTVREPHCSLPIVRGSTSLCRRVSICRT